MQIRISQAAPAVTLVDDEPATLDVLIRAAQMWQYECQAATSAEEALELLERHATPIVVTDLRMPGQGGIWLVKQIRQRWPNTAIIVLTGSHDPDYVSACLNAGATRYCTKPIDFDEFHRMLEETAARVRQGCEQERLRCRLEARVRRQTRKLRRTFLSAIDSLVRALEARDPYTSGHSLRVRSYALRLARLLRLDLHQSRQLSLAAKLHDIGKVGLPEAILNKPTNLTEMERAWVREHPVLGERILSPIIRNRQVLAAIRGHHECFDGTGYPDGLAGERIPLLARIITVADCFDAMTSSRAYRAALPVAQALAVLRQGAGTQFDPRFVLPFVEMIEKERHG